jgi:hypothetical protein
MFAPVSHFQSTCTQPVGNFHRGGVQTKPCTVSGSILATPRAVTRRQIDYPGNPMTSRTQQIRNFEISSKR